MSGSQRPLPRLLVSVRSVDEATAAIAGGCDLLDLKEPNRGSLGRLDSPTAHEICSHLERCPNAQPISVALGELSDWTKGPISFDVPNNVSLVKLGLSRCGPSWKSDWNRIRQIASESTAVRWVAVHYADPVADSPPLDYVMAEAIAAGCPGLLIDTCEKQRGRLFDFITPRELIGVREKLQAEGLFLAVAGSVQMADLPLLANVHPDVIAVRGAVCRSGCRTEAVSPEAVIAFRREIARVFSQDVEHPMTEAASSPIVAI